MRFLNHSTLVCCGLLLLVSVQSRGALSPSNIEQEGEVRRYLSASYKDSFASEEVKVLPRKSPEENLLGRWIYLPRYLEINSWLQ